MGVMEELTAKRKVVACYAEGAMREIVKEVIASPGREVDGLLVGKVISGDAIQTLYSAGMQDSFVPDRVVMVWRMISGRFGSDRSFAAVSHQDPDALRYQQAVLDIYQDGGLRYVGSWHKHPAGLDSPSGHDWQEAVRMLRDPAWGVNELLLPIALLAGESPWQFLEGASSEVKESAPYSVVSTAREMFRTVTRRAYDVSLHSHYISASDFVGGRIAACSLKDDLMEEVLGLTKTSLWIRDEAMVHAVASEICILREIAKEAFVVEVSQKKGWRGNEWVLRIKVQDPAWDGGFIFNVSCVNGSLFVKNVYACKGVGELPTPVFLKENSRFHSCASLLFALLREGIITVRGGIANG